MILLIRAQLVDNELRNHLPNLARLILLNGEVVFAEIKEVDRITDRKGNANLLVVVLKGEGNAAVYCLQTLAGEMESIQEVGWLGVPPTAVQAMTSS